MSPRPGGETDKFGNRYEGAWVVRHMLLILHGDGQSITLEDADPTREEGAEFTYLHGTSEEVHQLKRQNRNTNAWTVASLGRCSTSCRIWSRVPLRIHVAS
jgi:hypothetical protein